MRFAKVSLRKIRPVAVGDKFSSRSGQKGIASLLMRESDLPFTKDGIRPSLIFNPHGIPSRMTVAQLIESLLGNVCAIKGTHSDGTMFKNVDIESIAEELSQYGFNRYGYERMISGLTGEYIDTEVYFGPVYYQRLQKFVADAEYSVQHALTDAITYQPLDLEKSKLRTNLKLVVCIIFIQQHIQIAGTSC
jgi:DNA-directed RNA polymerase beta subunit